MGQVCVFPAPSDWLPSPPPTIPFLQALALGLLLKAAALAFGALVPLPCGHVLPALLPHTSFFTRPEFLFPSQSTVEPRILGDFPGGSDSEVSAYNVRDPGSVPGLGRSPGEGNGNPL